LRAESRITHPFLAPFHQQSEMFIVYNKQWRIKPKFFCRLIGGSTTLKVPKFGVIRFISFTTDIIYCHSRNVSIPRLNQIGPLKRTIALELNCNEFRILLRSQHKMNVIKISIWDGDQRYKIKLESKTCFNDHSCVHLHYMTTSVPV